MKVDIGIVGDCAHVLHEMVQLWKDIGPTIDKQRYAPWWADIASWRSRNCLAYRNEGSYIKPQYALERLEALTKSYDRYISTEVGQHQMWAAQFLHF